jgi:hypothetical protein
MLRAIACVALGGCISVTHSASPEAIRDAAPTLLREGTAIIAVDEDTDPPPADLPTTKLEAIRLDEPIRVRLGAEATATMTIADLFAGCPPDLRNGTANRRDYPRCNLFRADSIQTTHGHRADMRRIARDTAIAAAAAGDIACAADCGGRASEAAIGVGVTWLAVAGVAWYVHVLFEQPKLKH